MTRLESRIVENIWRFDPISLLKLLAHLGYGMEQILFCSNFSNCSQAGLLESIEFRRSPKKVLITLNLGLLGGQSVLPNYLFQQVHNNTIEAQRFAEFFGYFDDRLLRRFLLAIYPEFDGTALPQEWEDRKRTALYTLRLDSVVTLHWLMQLVFPELQTRVEKVTLQRRIDLGAPILGKTQLGHQAVFGKIKNLPMPGLRVTLITDEDNFTANRPWPVEIEQRLDRLVFPLLRVADLHLEVWLMIRTQATWLGLKQNSYLGYENLHGDSLQTRRIRIFSGRLYDGH
ncbi:MAG: hypothetical protein Q7U38_15190 [Methylobacter sp.]|nr:hypothetical protein [Methylobacter sp.]MDP2099411.1 hypothetical protein [Methylobacter sp.]MDP2429916.1 hypothetical protein [Methylobacter sp.]MDP3053179.1 hypothetical protein [Methylobacter sp.]MDP3360564.1 hypothetical protein [Methylobacter sp.]